MSKTTDDVVTEWAKNNDLALSEIQQHSHINFSDSVTKPSHISFYAGGGVEMMRLEANGDIYVKGRLVENDELVVQTFKQWLSKAVGNL